MFCKNCGKQLPDGARFCSSCGTPVEVPAPVQELEPLSDSIGLPRDEFPENEVLNSTPGEISGAEPDVPVPVEASAVPVDSPELVLTGEVPTEEPAVPVDSPEPVFTGEAPAEESAVPVDSPEPVLTGEVPAEEPAVPVDSPEPVLTGKAPAEEPAVPVDSPEPVFTGEAPAEESAAPVNASELVPVYEAPAEDAAQPSAKRRGNAVVFAVMGVAAVAIIALIVLAVRMLPGLLGGGGQPAVVYLNDDDELMYLAGLKEKTQALEVTDEAASYTNAAFSPDGKTVYFTDSDLSLYGITAAELKKGGKPQRISRDVNGFFVLKDGKVVYTQYDNGENKMSIYDNGESYRLLRGYSDFRFSEDEKSVYYTERDESDGTITLYRIDVAKDAKEERLLKGATTIYTGYDSDLLVYGVDERGGDIGGYTLPGDGSTVDNNTLTVYSCTPGGDRTRLVSDVYSISGVTVDGGKVSFHYYVEDREERTLYDFVTDDKAREDADTLSGEEPEYPYWGDYSVDEILVDYSAVLFAPGAIYYTNGRGEEWPIDISGLLGTSYSQGDLDYWDVYDLAYEDAQARYNAALEDYNARYEAWSGAENREDIRENLKTSQYSQISYSLYQYTDGGKGEPVATGISTGSRISATGSFGGIFLYHKVSMEDGKVADVADLDYSGQVRDMLAESGADDDEQWYQNVGGKESEIDLDDVERVYGIYVLNNKEAVLDVYDGYEESYRSFSIGKDALAFTSTIVEGNDISDVQKASVSGSDVLYLFTDTEMDSDYNMMSNTRGDFCVYKDGKLETIAREIYMAMILDESGAAYAVTDVNDRDGSMELAALKDGSLTTISDEVSGTPSPIFLDSAQLLYISDGDLCLWNGKEERRIARDVEGFWASTGETYRIYTAY